MKISLIITAIILIIQIIIRPDSVYISDSLVKAIQVKSLFLNDWNSQDVFYPAKEYDPLYTMNPLNEGFIFFNKGRFIGQYPVALSFFYSIILFLGFSVLPYLNSLILFPMVFLYSKNLYNKNNLFYLLFGTTLIITIIDFSECSIFYSLTGIGFLFIKKYIDQRVDTHFIIGNIILGIAIWFRLEVLLFTFSIYLTLFIIYLQKKEFTNIYKLIFHSLTFIFLVLIFFFFNYQSYDSILGPRYIVNIHSNSLSIFEKVRIFFSILFTYPRESNLAMGFYFISPIFLYSIVYFLKNIKSNSVQNNFYLGQSLIFSLLIGTTAPNDGITITARYMAIAVFPLIFLLDEHYETYTDKKVPKIFSILNIYSFLVSFILLLIFYFSSTYLRKATNYVNKIESDLIITSNEFISGSFQLGYFNKKILSLKNNNQINEISVILNKNNISNIQLLGFNSILDNKLTINPINELHTLLKKNNYNCKEMENKINLMHYSCEKNSN
jgi:hypothetical protein